MNALPSVMLGSQAMTVTSAVLVPGVATDYQVTAQAPHIVQPGDNVQLTITSGAVSTTQQVRVVVLRRGSAEAVRKEEIRRNECSKFGYARWLSQPSRRTPSNGGTSA